METECETGDHDDKDYGNCKEGEDDILEENDIFPYSVQEPHVEEQVDPGEGEGDGTDLPVQAGASPNEVVGSHEESEDVDEGIKEEDGRQGWPFQLECLQLAPDGLVLLGRKEEYDP